MIRCAIVDGSGRVVNVVGYEAAPVSPPPGFPEDHVAIPSETAQIGWTVVDGALVDPSPAPSLAPTLADYQRAVEAHVEAAAAQRGYSSGASCAGYVASTVIQWRNEATAFIAWRDAVWGKVFTDRATWEAAGSDPATAPTIQAVLDGLPAIAWPNA